MIFGWASIGGTATEFAGTIEDYTDYILGRGGAGEGRAGAGDSAKANRKEGRRAAAEAREKSQGLRKAVKAAETTMATLTTRRSAIERAMFDPSSADPIDRDQTMTALMKRRADVQAKLDAAEAEWLAASEALEAAEV